MICEVTGRRYEVGVDEQLICEVTGRRYEVGVDE